MDAPLWLTLEMETLILLFHSLWILQCNTVSADSIIHIGKNRPGRLSCCRQSRAHGSTHEGKFAVLS